MQSDEEFRLTLAEIRQGDESALNSMLDSWRSVLRIQAHGLLGEPLAPRADSSDLVQETMFQAFADFENFRGKTKGEWMSWLRGILVAKAHKLRRFHRAEKRAPAHEVAALEDLPDGPQDPDATLMANERLARVAMAMSELPTPMYEVIFRRFFLKQPFAEVAESLNRSPGATRVLLLRAVRKLNEQITDESESQSGIDPE